MSLWNHGFYEIIGGIRVRSDLCHVLQMSSCLNQMIKPATLFYHAKWEVVQLCYLADAQ